MCRTTLNNLANSAKVILFWVSWLHGIAENKQINKVAKAGLTNKDKAEAKTKTLMATIRTDSEECIKKNYISQWLRREECQKCRPDQIKENVEN